MKRPLPLSSAAPAAARLHRCRSRRRPLGAGRGRGGRRQRYQTCWRATSNSYARSTFRRPMPMASSAAAAVSAAARSTFMRYTWRRLLVRLMGPGGCQCHSAASPLQPLSGWCVCVRVSACVCVCVCACRAPRVCVWVMNSCRVLCMLFAMCPCRGTH